MSGTDVITMQEHEAERYELREPLAYVFRVNRRQFIGGLGAGIVFALCPPDAAGQRRSPPAATDLESRLHIGEDGRITVLNGKIEEGQGARTELAMAAAEELRVPLDQITVIMADTAATPSDGITAGSRTTPSTVPAVRQAAAAARHLLDQYSQSKNNAKLTYTDLGRSPELKELLKQPVKADLPLRKAAEWQVLGTPQHRINARELVTGAHQFPSDVQRPGMLYGAVLRPPSYEATLQSIDLKAATSMPNVTAVHDGNFVACAAPTSYAARKAVQALAATAKWNEKSVDTNHQNVYEHLVRTARREETGRNRPKREGNVEEALAGAAKRFKASYRVAYIQHAPMEPRAAVAEWQDGNLTVWTGTSNPFSVRDQLAQAFSINPQNVRVIAPDFGGGFGGKHTGEAAMEAARLAREAGKPVSLRWTRAEEFTWAYSRPAGVIEAQAGLDANGGIAAWEFLNYNSGGSAIDTPYKTANLHIRSLPSDSPLRQGSYRALASTFNNFAREAFLDELAEAAGMDPLAYRLAHLDNDRIREVLKAAAAKFGWEERRKQQKKANRGMGLACGTEKNSVVAACAEVEVDPKTGTPRLLEICEAYECGAILNPAGLRAQVEGCIMMGLAALREEIQFANGRVTNARFAQYRVPRFRDMPKMDIVLVDRKDAESVGAGETPIIAVAPAMANAVYAATGKRVRSLPFRNDA